jgi:hypothetical protein
VSGSRDSTLASATSFPDYDFPVYLVDGRPSLAPVTVPGKPRVLVISMPKAGTYLLAAYLKKLGLVDTGIHINDDGFSDYRGKTISEVVSRYREFRTFCSLSTVTDLMHEGQFAVGHISCNSTTRRYKDHFLQAGITKRVDLADALAGASRTGRRLDLERNQGSQVQASGVLVLLWFSTYFVV